MHSETIAIWVADLQVLFIFHQEKLSLASYMQCSLVKFILNELN